MSGNNFTPGPWRIEEGEVHHKGYFVITATCMGTPSSPLAKIGGARWDETSRFDAALIAAAPDLYAALEMAKEMLDQYEQAATGESFNSLQINAALAKARGET